MPSVIVLEFKYNGLMGERVEYAKLIRVEENEDTVQELNAANEALKSTVQELKVQNEKMMHRIEKLENK